jgi:hypothetical protein
MSDTLMSTIAGTDVPWGQTTKQRSALSSLLSQDKSSYPGATTLADTMGLSPEGFQGQDVLKTFMARNPYSADYEQATGALYDRMFDKARATAISGPANVRSGQGQKAIELAELGNLQSINRFKEVRGQQDQEASVINNAIQLFNTIEHMRRGSQITAQGAAQQGETSIKGEQLAGAQATDRMRANQIATLQMVAELLGFPSQTHTEDMSGRGSGVTGTESWQTGLSCCFIFLEALNGKLPWYVRWGRECYRTENRIRGYRWLAKRLVPAMQRWALVKQVVNSLIVKPFLRWGEALYITRKPSVWKPYCWAWFHAWSFIGWVGGKA